MIAYCSKVLRGLIGIMKCYCCEHWGVLWVLWSATVVNTEGSYGYYEVLLLWTLGGSYGYYEVLLLWSTGGSSWIQNCFLIAEYFRAELCATYSCPVQLGEYIYRERSQLPRNTGYVSVYKTWGNLSSLYTSKINSLGITTSLGHHSCSIS